MACGENGPVDNPDYGDALRSLHDLAPTAVVDTVARLAQSAGAVDVVIYLVDFEQEILLPVPERGTHVDLPVGEAVATTSAGRAFVGRALVSEARHGTHRVWVPILEGTDCTGVLALSVVDPLDEAARRRCEELGLLAGLAVTNAARYTDLYNLIRRRKAMSLPASMQWDMLPPLRLRSSEVESVGMLEPAYEVGGDCFDHAINGFELDVAIMDAMGHGLRSSMLSGLAMGVYRHDRREGRPLGLVHQRLDTVVAECFGGDAFITGQLARLDLTSGGLSWVNAGHPLPLLVRRGRVERELACPPCLPWGLDSALAGAAEEALAPGDAVLFHTDGILESRNAAGNPLGRDGLEALVERATASSDSPSAVVRHLLRGVVGHQDGDLRDDATLLLVTWNGPDPRS